jgi:phage terminase large subunit GpA-like protein
MRSLPWKLTLVMTALISSNPAVAEWIWAANLSRTPRLRALREFATTEIRIPEGPSRGQRLRIPVQPYVGLLYDAIDEGTWPRVAVLGCVQGGKSLCGWVIPTLYHLFEYRETVICGMPTMDVAKRKWENELLPAIRASRFRGLLPADGGGSRGGWSEQITFTNGAHLRFMSGHGGDEKRSSDTTRVVVITEADKMDEAAESSRETDPVSQLEDRMLRYDEDQRRFYCECTVSIARGRIWTEWTNGTASRIACPCHRCKAYVTPEREHLHGWQDAETKFEARKRAHFCCPECGCRINDRQRTRMNRRAKLVHRGQTIDRAGRIRGQPPQTDTLGFRWNAFNNLFWSIGTIAAAEWKAARQLDEEAAAREMQQFYWAMPYQSPEWDQTPLDANQVRRRFAGPRYTKGLVPEDAQALTVGVDVHKRLLWWVAIAWLADGSGHICDYGAWDVPSDDMDLEPALLKALRGFREEAILPGWGVPGAEPRVPDYVWIDAGWQGDVIYAFCRESGKPFLPALGCGAGNQYSHRYTHPRRTDNEVKLLGTGYHIRWSRQNKLFYVRCDADHWKSFLHQRLATPEDQPGAMRFYHSSDRNEHIRISKHLTAERAVEEFKPGRGLVTRWHRQSKANHMLDAAYNACAAAHLHGVRLVKPDTPAAPTAPRPRIKTRTLPDGRPYMVTER